MLDLSAASPIKKLRLEFSASDPIHVYGVSFDQAHGAYVDNFPIRGYSGMYFQRIQSEVLKGFQQNLGYDLIILQYGENVSSPKIRDYSYYARGMKNTIKHIQAAIPGVPILLISAHDRSFKNNGNYATSPDIPYLVATQSQIAKDTGCGFWNLFAAMGGMDSMPGYVNHKPAWAGKDYTHFTRAGGEHIATMLYSYLKGE
jgi:lysophospholipase L1-like esterase